MRVTEKGQVTIPKALRDELGIGAGSEVTFERSDDGIVIHLPDADEPPPGDLVMIEPDELEDLVIRELSGSALFGARFRENASRSLLIPRAWPGKRRSGASCTRPAGSERSGELPGHA